MARKSLRRAAAEHADSKLLGEADRDWTNERRDLPGSAVRRTLGTEIANIDLGLRAYENDAIEAEARGKFTDTSTRGVDGDNEWS